MQIERAGDKVVATMTVKEAETVRKAIEHALNDYYRFNGPDLSERDAARAFHLEIALRAFGGDRPKTKTIADEEIPF